MGVVLWAASLLYDTLVLIHVSQARAYILFKFQYAISRCSLSVASFLNGVCLRGGGMCMISWHVVFLTSEFQYNDIFLKGYDISTIYQVIQSI